MKTKITMTLMLSISLTAFSQQTKKTNTVVKAEKKYDEAVQTQKYLVEQESNALAKESLIKLNDTTLSDNDREIYINNYRNSIRNGNPAIKKKSYDLTPEENNKEILDLSKSPKFNKKAKATCVVMYENILKQIERQKAIAANPLADENCPYYLRLADTTKEMGYGNRLQCIESYIDFKCGVSPAPKDKKKAMLLEMSKSKVFSRKTKDFCLETYNKYK